MEAWLMAGDPQMKIGILGAGLMGSKLGILFARAGHEVRFSFSRHPEKLESLAKEAGRKAKATSPSEAVKESAVLIIAVNWWQLPELLLQCGPIHNKIVLSCSLPMKNDNSGLLLTPGSSGSEELAKLIPKAKVVLAFNSVPSEVLFKVFERRKTKPRPSLLYCGDHAGAKTKAAKLIRDLGFEAQDLGNLKTARHLEPFALLVAQLAYEGARGPKMAYRFEWL
jgi:predicted dinucleotide-binding enzyme